MAVQSEDIAKDNQFSFGYQFIAEYGIELASGNIPWIKKDLLPILSSLLEEKEELRILGIGSGTGHSDCVLLKEVIDLIQKKNYKVKIHYTVVEPDKNAVKVFDNENSIPIKKSYDAISFTWHATPMEEFFLNNRYQKFDVVHFFHSLCWRGGREKIFHEVLTNNIGGSGIVFAVSGNPNNLWLDLRGKYFGGEDHGHHHHHHGDGNEHGKHGEFNSGTFDKENNCKSMCFLKPSETDVTEILKKSAEGKRKLDALIDAHNIHGRVKESEFDEIVKVIERNANVTKMVEGVKRFYVSLEDEVVIIWRQ